VVFPKPLITKRNISVNSPDRLDRKPDSREVPLPTDPGLGASTAVLLVTWTLLGCIVTLDETMPIHEVSYLCETEFLAAIKPTLRRIHSRVASVSRDPTQILSSRSHPRTRSTQGPSLSWIHTRRTAMRSTGTLSRMKSPSILDENWGRRASHT
jgi:hypothetical protein